MYILHPTQVQNWASAQITVENTNRRNIWIRHRCPRTCFTCKRHNSFPYFENVQYFMCPLWQCWVIYKSVPCVCVHWTFLRILNTFILSITQKFIIPHCQLPYTNIKQLSSIACQNSLQRWIGASCRRRTGAPWRWRTGAPWRWRNVVPWRWRAHAACRPPGYPVGPRRSWCKPWSVGLWYRRGFLFYR